MGAFASGLLGSYSERLHEHNLLDLEDEMKRRKMLADTLIRRISDPEERPEAKEEYEQKLQILLSTPGSKSLPKGLDQFSINIKPQEGKSLAKAPAQPGTTPTLPNIPGEAQGSAGAVSSSAPSPGAGLGMPRLPEPPSEVPRKFSPAEMGQMAAAEALPRLEQANRLKLEQSENQAEVPINLARDLSKETGMSIMQAYLFLKGKTGAVAAPNVLLKDGTISGSTRVINPGDTARYFKDGKEITNLVVKEAGLSSPPGDKPVVVGGEARGVVINGKTWYGSEENIPEEVKRALEALKAPPADKVTTRTQYLDTGTEKRKVTTSSRTSTVGSKKGPVKTEPPPGITSGPTSLRSPDVIKKTYPLTSSTRTRMETAPKVIFLVNEADEMVDKIASDLGPGEGRWSKFWAGDVGAEKPEWTRFKTNTKFLSTLLMNMHVGARGSQKLMEHFQELYDAGKQSPANLKAAFAATRRYAEFVAKNPDADPTDFLDKEKSQAKTLLTPEKLERALQAFNESLPKGEPRWTLTRFKNDAIAKGYYKEK